MLTKVLYYIHVRERGVLSFRSVHDMIDINLSFQKYNTNIVTACQDQTTVTCTNESSRLCIPLISEPRPFDPANWDNDQKTSVQSLNRFSWPLIHHRYSCRLVNKNQYTRFISVLIPPFTFTKSMMHVDSIVSFQPQITAPDQKKPHLRVLYAKG